MEQRRSAAPIPAAAPEGLRLQDAPGSRLRSAKKKVKDENLADTLKRIGEREFEINGERFTYFELELLALHKKAAKGDVAASRHLARLRAEAGLLKPEERKSGGVLAVPMTIDPETWELLAERQQAKFRTSEPWNPEEFVLDPTSKDPGVKL